jgi:hypothetical protein
LPADYTFTTTDGGIHTFVGGATLKTAGVQSFTATDTVTSSITATRANITIKAAAAVTLQVTGFPSPSTSGVAGTFTVIALDAYGNIATGFHGTVRFSSSDALASLPPNYQFVAADGGVHTFSATLYTPGTQSITVTDPANSSITGSEDGITVTVAPRDSRLPEPDDDAAEDIAAGLPAADAGEQTTALPVQVPGAEWVVRDTAAEAEDLDALLPAAPGRLLETEAGPADARQQLAAAVFSSPEYQPADAPGTGAARAVASVLVGGYAMAPRPAVSHRRRHPLS